MPDQNTIGGVNFEITATGAPQAQAAIKETARVAEEAANQTTLPDAGGGNPIDNAGKATGILARAGELAATLAGHMGAVVSTAGTFYLIGTKIREGIVAALETGIERAQKFRDTLDLSNVKASYDETAKKLQEINDKIEEGLASYVSRGGEVTRETAEIEKQQKATEALLITLQKTLKAREDSLKAAKEQADQDEADARDRKAIFEALLRQNEERFNNETEEKARKEREKKDAEEIERRKKDEYELAQYEANLRDQARREQETKDKASLQRRAAEARASFRATLADAANAAVGNEIVYSLSKIGGALESIRSQTASRDLSNSGGFE